MSRRYNRGFTLVELLIALVIFATLSILAYGGLNTILAADEQTRQHAARLKMLQRGWMVMGQELSQLVGRSVRDNYGDPQPPISASEFGTIQLEFTRGGRSNPLGMKRSELQRVGYGVVDGQLLRYSWQVLDRAQDSEPQQLMLIDEVEGMTIRLLDQQQQWHSSWPPISADESLSLLMPVGVEVVLELKPEGEIRRLFRTVGASW